jgi:hypothetical protein
MKEIIWNLPGKSFGTEHFSTLKMFRQRQRQRERERWSGRDRGSTPEELLFGKIGSKVIWKNLSMINTIL